MNIFATMRVCVIILSVWMGLLQAVMNEHIKRVTIFGNSGSGKSTLAQKLHAILKFPVYYLDQFFWKAYWTPSDFDEYKVVHDALCDKDEWIIEGKFVEILEYRIQRADVVIFLDIPRYLCIWRLFKRAIQYYGKETPSSAKKCPEKINWAFFAFLKRVWDFKAQYSTKIMELLKAYAGTKEIYIFKSQKEIDQFVENMGKKGSLCLL